MGCGNMAWDIGDQWEQFMKFSDILIHKGYGIYCGGEAAYKYARDILLQLVGGEITLLYSVGKKSWGSRPSKRKGYGIPQKEESWQVDEVSGSSDAEDDVEDVSCIFCFPLQCM